MTAAIDVMTADHRVLRVEDAGAPLVTRNARPINIVLREEDAGAPLVARNARLINIVSREEVITAPLVTPIAPFAAPIPYPLSPHF